MKRRNANPTVSDPRAAHAARETRSVLKVGEDFYILASSIASRRKHRVLANAHSFAVFDVGGDILESPLEAFGFFHSDTRYLSRFELRLELTPQLVAVSNATAILIAAAAGLYPAWRASRMTPMDAIRNEAS